MTNDHDDYDDSLSYRSEGVVRIQQQIVDLARRRSTGESKPLPDHLMSMLDQMSKRRKERAAIKQAMRKKLDTLMPSNAAEHARYTTLAWASQLHVRLKEIVAEFSLAPVPATRFANANEAPADVSDTAASLLSQLQSEAYQQMAAASGARWLLINASVRSDLYDDPGMTLQFMDTHALHSDQTPPPDNIALSVDQIELDEGLYQGQLTVQTVQLNQTLTITLDAAEGSSIDLENTQVMLHSTAESGLDQLTLSFVRGNGQSGS